MSGQISEKPVLTELCELLRRPIAPEDLQRARLHLLDWVGCAIAGSKHKVGEILLAADMDVELNYAFALGGLGNILEMDDVDKRGLLHPGPTIIPASLAAARTEGVSVPSVLEAIVCGYEATIRLGRAVGPHHYSLWHSTGTCGAIGAAAAAAKIYGLGLEEMCHALSLAVSQSAGLWHTRHDATSMGKQLHTANAARAGLHAAQLARAGFRGPLSILEGQQGFFEAMCPDGSANAVVKNMGPGWTLHDVSFKPWPACRHAHAAIDGALVLRSDIDLESVSKVTVGTYADALKFCDQPNPKSEVEAKFSLQHAVAVALCRGLPRLEDFDVTAIGDPTVSALRSKVSVEVNRDYEAAYPAQFGAEIVCGEHRVVISDALGDPENPVSKMQLENKAKMLMQAGRMNEEQSIALRETVLSDVSSCEQLLAQLNEALL